MSVDNTQPQIRETEYLVVGAGAAGCTFGFLMKRAGADVLLLEMQNAQQRFKLCAGILEPRALEAFHDIFGETVDEAGFAAMPIGTVCARNENYELRRAMPGLASSASGAGASGLPAQKSWSDSILGYVRTGGKALAKKVLLEALGFDPGGDFTFRTMPRKRFDDYTRDRFLAEGGQILYHTKILSVDEKAGLAECVDLYTKETFSVRFRHIIGADGAASSVRRLLTGRQQRVFLALEAAVPLIRRDSVGSYGKGSLGYCWYLPRGNDATVGCGYHCLGADAYDICYRRLTAFCADLGLTVPLRFRGAFIPEGNDVLLRPGERAWLLGDAAGLNDAFTGGGIHYALLSAKALAASFLHGGNDSAFSSAASEKQAANCAYEEAMQPHVRFVKKSSDNVKQYYYVAYSAISGFGKRRG